MTSFFRGRLLASSLFVGAVALAAPVNAQTVPSDAEVVTPDSAPDANETIVVTGSRIARPNDASSIPIVSTTAAELFNTGRVSVGDQLNALPSLRSTVGQQNSTVNLGTAGLNLLDLRGLGPQRTLVLQNGRRHVGGDILFSGVNTDINTIPSDLIERVDIVTGGNSAVYGSDAIAGVVNFILKDNYDGISMRAQGGISDKGDAGAYSAGIVAGRNFAEGRGNIAVNLEYARQDDFYASDRSDLANRTGLIVVDTDPANSVNGSDGTPDRRLFTGIRSATLGNGGQLGFASPTGACGVGGNGLPFTCAFVFQPDGTLVPQTGQRVGIGPNGSFIGGNGSSLVEGRTTAILPRNERYAINALGHFEISPAFVPFFEAKYVRSNTLGSASGPAFIQGTTLGVFGGDERERPRLDNPFLNPAARALITSQLLAADPDAVIADDTRFALRENLVGLGLRQEAAKRETYRIVVGVKGDFASDFHYELSANYGEFREKTRVLGNINTQRFQLANDVARNAAGQIVCRSQIDPTAAIPLGGDVASDAAIASLANDVASCVPVNLFGEGNVSQAARNYITQDTVSRGKITQFDVSGFVSGNTAQFFNLPGGPIGFAVGGEFRRETNFFQADPLVQNGLTFYNALAPFASPAFEVKEAYGELRIPVLKDITLIHELTVNGAGRISDYKGAVGTVYAYNFGGDYSPFDGLRFRANYARSVRAPNVGESFAQQGQNFATGFVDPCSARNIATGTQFRDANCAAAGRPAGYDFNYVQSLGIVSGGNPSLTEETSDSYTYGAVITPKFIPGLAISVDYYNIKVKRVIASLDAQDIADNCYDSPTLANPFCALFQRNTAAVGPSREIPFQILEGSLLQSSANFAALQTRGVDVDVSYRRQLGIGSFNTHLIYTRVIQNDSFTDPARPDYADQTLGELGDPQDRFVWNVNLATGPFEFGYKMRYIGSQYTGAAENVVSVQGRPPENADFSSPQKYKAVFYNDLQVGFNVQKNFNFYIGCENFLDQKPPLGSNAIGAGSGIYDARGRYLYAGASVKF